MFRSLLVALAVCALAACDKPPDPVQACPPAPACHSPEDATGAASDIAPASDVSPASNLATDRAVDALASNVRPAHAFVTDRGVDAPPTVDVQIVVTPIVDPRQANACTVTYAVGHTLHRSRRFTNADCPRSDLAELRSNHRASQACLHDLRSGRFTGDRPCSGIRA